MNKKKGSALIGLALSIALLAGCGSNAQTGTNSGTESAGGEKATSATLKMFIAQPRFKEQYDAHIEKFKAKVKAEKNIDLTVQVEMPNQDNAAQILKTRLASNDAPDLFVIHAINDIPQYSKAGYLADLSDEPFADKLLDSVKPAVTNSEGQVVAVPLESLSWGYLYNKTIFKEQGLTPPSTLSEMEAVVAKLKEQNITPFLLSYKEAWVPQLFLPLTVGAAIQTENGMQDFVERMNEDKGSFSELKSMFNIIDLVNSNGTDRALEVGPDDGAATFAQGKTAMWVQGPWYADSILASNPDIDFGVAALPVSENPDAALINLSVSSSMAMYADTKNKELSLEFLNFLLDDTESNALYESLKFNPIATIHTFKSYPWVDDATAYVQAGKSYQDPRIPQAVKDEVGKALQSYVAGQMDQDAVLKALDKSWKDYNKVNK